MALPALAPPLAEPLVSACDTPKLKLLISKAEVLLLKVPLAGLLDVAVNNIHVPTMLVHGLLSDVVTQEGVDDLVARIPDATVVAVDGAAHMIAGDKNDVFSDAVVTFLEDRIRPNLP